MHKPTVLNQFCSCITVETDLKLDKHANKTEILKIKCKIKNAFQSIFILNNAFLLLDLVIFF